MRIWRAHCCRGVFLGFKTDLRRTRGRPATGLWRRVDHHGDHGAGFAAAGASGSGWFAAGRRGAGDGAPPGTAAGGVGSDAGAPFFLEGSPGRCRLRSAGGVAPALAESLGAQLLALLFMVVLADLLLQPLQMRLLLWFSPEAVPP